MIYNISDDLRRVHYITLLVIVYTAADRRPITDASAEDDARWRAPRTGRRHPNDAETARG